MKNIFVLVGLLFALTITAHSQYEHPVGKDFSQNKVPPILESCQTILRSKNDFVAKDAIDAFVDDIYFGPIGTEKPRFMLPTLCDLMCVRLVPGLSRTNVGAMYTMYPASSILRDYGSSISTRLADIYVDPQLRDSVISSKEELRERRDVAFELLLVVLGPQGPELRNDTLILRRQADTYRSYANRMSILATRAEGSSALPLPAPASDTRSDEEKLRRACEILLMIEAIKDKPLTRIHTALGDFFVRLESPPHRPLVPAEEAKLVRELGTLRQGFSASTLVEYLTKPVEGLDKAEVKGALLALGEEATPEVLRFLRADGRQPAELQEALALLVALCGTPEKTKARLLQTAQINEDGAKRFEEQAARMTQ